MLSMRGGSKESARRGGGTRGSAIREGDVVHEVVGALGDGDDELVVHGRMQAHLTAKP